MTEELDLDLETEEEEPEVVPGDQSGEANKALREYVKRLQKKHRKELEKAAKDAEDRAYNSVARSTMAAQYASTLGYPKLGDLFVKTNPEAEVTQESIQSFIEDMGLKPPNTEEEETSSETEEVVQQASTFQRGGAGATPPEKVYSAKEWLEVYQQNPQEADRIARAGQVKVRPGVSGGGEFKIRNR